MHGRKNIKLRFYALLFKKQKRAHNPSHNSLFFCTSYQQLFLFLILEVYNRFSVRSFDRPSKDFRGFSQPLLNTTMLNNIGEEAGI